MPKEITHITLADETVKELGKNGETTFSRLLSEFSEFLHFGSIAVDTFYYSLKIPILERDYFPWGDMVHGAEGNDTSLALIEMIDTLKENQDDPYFKQKLAFTCGYLTHMAMDINFHPYIYYFSGNYYHEIMSEQIDAQMRHRLIESWIDLYILEQRSIRLKDYTAIENIRKNNEINLKLLELLAQSYSKIWQPKQDIFKFLKKGYFLQMLLSGTLFKNKAFTDFVRWVNDIFDNKLRSVLALCYPFNYQEIPKYIIEFEMFKHPSTGEEFRGSLRDLWQNSIGLSAEFLTAVNDYIFADGNKEKLKSVIKGYSLDVGLVGVKVQDVRHFAPWQLVP
jgi:hypothetical protein